MSAAEFDIAAEALALDSGTGRFSTLRAVWGTLEGKIGVVILLLFVLMVVFGPSLAPHGPNDIGVGVPNAPPSGQDWLGTDSLGRDVLSRLLAGSRSVILIPIFATLLAFLVGGLSGMAAGYRGGRLDAIIGRTVDVLISLPYLLVVLVVVTVLRASTGVLIIAVALVFAPRVARVLRGATRTIATREFVQAAEARGESTRSIVVYELLPNIMPTVLVEIAARLTYAIIFVSTLNFLGLGLQPPSPNWAVMVAESETTIVTRPLQTIAPALAIGILSVGVSLIADAMTQGVGRTGGRNVLR
jgi:ABC-type dipeptide/oligopeptide/nickel transport system permease subunit